MKKTARPTAWVAKEHCVACGTCVKVCPRGALSVYKGLYAAVDTTLCIGCGLCTKACPADIIQLKEALSHDA